MDSTSMDINGNVYMEGDPVLDLHIRPFYSTRGNLLTLLIRSPAVLLMNMPEP